MANIAETSTQNIDHPFIKTRKAITVKIKLDIITRYGDGESLTQIAKSLNLNRSTIATILKDKQKILNHVTKDTSSLLKSRLVKTSLIIKRPITGKLEHLLVNWMTEENLWSEPIDKNLIQQKAMNLYEDLKTTNSIDNELPAFKASRGWFDRFKQRNEYRIRYDSENIQKVEVKTFVSSLEMIIQESKYTNFQLFNVGEMEILWKFIPEKYKNLLYSNKLPNSSDRISVLLCNNAAGECQLTPLLVYHTENPSALKNITKLSLPVIWSSNEQGIITKEIFRQWFFKNFIPEVTLYCETKKISFKIILLLSQSLAHLIHPDDLHPDIKLIYIPSEINSELEPMERGIFNIFSNLYLRKLLSDVLESIECKHAMDLEEFWNNYSVYNCLKNIKYCWDELATEYKSALISTWNKIHAGFVTKFVNPQVVVDSIIQDTVNIDKRLEKTTMENSVKNHKKHLHNNDDCGETKKKSEISIKEKMSDKRQEYSMNLENMEGVSAKQEISKVLQETDKKRELLIRRKWWKLSKRQAMP